MKRQTEANLTDARLTRDNVKDGFVELWRKPIKKVTLANGHYRT